MKIWTFWEPRDKMPVYIQMCMETWKKFLPDAEVIMVDRSNLKEYVDMGDFEETLFSSGLSLPLISDAVRAFLLDEHGGIWLDADTIFLNESVRKYFVDDGSQTVTFFGSPSKPSVHLAFIKSIPIAAPPHLRGGGSKLIHFWRESIRYKMENFSQPAKRKWAYLGNDCIDPYLIAFPYEAKTLSNRLVMPEIQHLPVGTDITDHKKIYQQFYFFQHQHLRDFNNDMIMLHNSWTPGIFKVANFNELMYFDCTLANILFEVLEIDRSHIKDFLFFEQD